MEDFPLMVPLRSAATISIESACKMTARVAETSPLQDNRCSKMFTIGPLAIFITALICRAESTSESALSTIGGNSEGAACVFPFTYGGIQYSSCTSAGQGDGRLWCATSTNYDKDHRWGFCQYQALPTVGGTDDGSQCIFPFTYNGTQYQTCTSAGQNDGRLWCATTTSYGNDHKWGFCWDRALPTAGGNANGAPCVFPFTYGGIQYNSCTSAWQDDGRLWCATTNNYDNDRKWGLCRDQALLTVGGNAGGERCVFPFTYRGTKYYSCTSAGQGDGRLWCATTSNYDGDNKWGFCSDRALSKIGGNADGSPCVFPFTFGGIQYNSCTNIGQGDGRLWCAVTSNYSNNRKWRFCQEKAIMTHGGNAGGSPCVFPFTYGGVQYYSCTSFGQDEGMLWCATTNNYDEDRKWGFCPVQEPKTKGGNGAGSPHVLPIGYDDKPKHYDVDDKQAPLLKPKAQQDEL